MNIYNLKLRFSMELNEMNEFWLSGERRKKRWNEKVKGMLIKNKLEESRKEMAHVNSGRGRESVHIAYDLISTQNWQRTIMRHQSNGMSCIYSDRSELCCWAYFFSSAKGIFVFQGKKVNSIKANRKMWGHSAQSWWIQWTKFDKMNYAFAYCFFVGSITSEQYNQLVVATATTSHPPSPMNAEIIEIKIELIISLMHRGSNDSEKLF